jgi:hypothetical protein
VDLRSQQVRDTTQLLIKLADVTGERMKALLRDSFSTILEGVKVPHKVGSLYTLIYYCLYISILSLYTALIYYGP